MMQLLKLPKNQKIYLSLNDIKFNKDEFENYLKTYEDKEIKIKQTTNGFVYFKKDEPNNFYNLKDNVLYNTMIDYIQTQIVDKTSIKELIAPKKLKEYEWLLSLGIDFHKEFNHQMLVVNFQNLTLNTPILTPIDYLFTYFPKDFEKQYNKNNTIQHYLTPLQYHNQKIIVDNYHPFITLKGMGREFYQSKYLSYLKTTIEELDVNELRKKQLNQSYLTLKYLYNELELKDVYHHKDVYTIDLEPHIYLHRAAELDELNKENYNDLLYLYNNQGINLNGLDKLKESVRIYLKHDGNDEIFKKGYLKEVLSYKFNYEPLKINTKIKDETQKEI